MDLPPAFPPVTPSPSTRLLTSSLMPSLPRSPFKTSLTSIACVHARAPPGATSHRLMDNSEGWRQLTVCLGRASLTTCGTAMHGGTNVVGEQE